MLFAHQIVILHCLFWILVSKLNRLQMSGCWKYVLCSASITYRMLLCKYHQQLRKKNIFKDIHCPLMNTEAEQDTQSLTAYYKCSFSTVSWVPHCKPVVQCSNLTRTCVCGILSQGVSLSYRSQAWPASRLTKAPTHLVPAQQNIDFQNILFMFKLSMELSQIFYWQNYLKQTRAHRNNYELWLA